MLGELPLHLHRTMDHEADLRFYIDYDRMARDLEIHDVFVIQTSFEQVHIFWNH